MGGPSINRGPLVLEYVEADGPVVVDVGVERGQPEGTLDGAW